MPKTLQNIMILIDSAKYPVKYPNGFYADEYHTSVKIATSYMNRFTIDEDASFELIGVHDLFGGATGKLFSRQVTEIERKMPTSIIRESETHVMIANSDGAMVVYPNKLLRQRIYDMFEILVSKLHLKLVMVTKISMMREKLITKEMMEAFPKGKERIQQSIHDDLDNFFEKLQFENFKYKLKGRPEFIESYFLPKLTVEEQQLVQSKDKLFMRTLWEKDPNKILQNMKKSESKAMYIMCYCVRLTYQIEDFLNRLKNGR